MTTHLDYTDSEWKALLDLPRLAAFGAMAVDRGDPIASTRELFAAMHQMGILANATYADNPLIQAIVAEITAGGDDALGADVDWRPDSGEVLGAALVDQVHDTARRARAILDEQSADIEATEYAEWVLGIARAACEAAGDGLFGLGGNRLAPAERQFIADLAAALGTT